MRLHLNTSRITISLLVALISAHLALAAANDSETWSVPTNGLQARLTLVENPKLYGTRWLVPFLELRNVRDVGNQMEVQCDSRHLKIELVDSDGKVIRDGWSLMRSGPVNQLTTIILPWDSSIHISLECKNWGVPKDSAAMVSTDSGAWVILEAEKGKVYLRATLTGEKTEPEQKAWNGRVQTPLLKVDWK